MLRWITPLAIVGAIVIALVGCNESTTGPGSNGDSREPAAPSGPIGDPLYPVVEPPKPGPESAPNSLAVDSIVIPDCRLAVFDKRDLGSPREGVLLFLGTEIPAGESVPPDQVYTLRQGEETKRFRRLKEGDVVQKDQILGRIDDQLAWDEWKSKEAKIEVSISENDTAKKTRDEARVRWKRIDGLPGQAREEVDERKLGYEKYYNDAIAKEKAIVVAKLEANQARTVWELHQIKSTIPGIIKTIYKKSGESVKNLDPVVQIFNLGVLRVEGHVPIQYAQVLRKGMKAVVEPSVVQPPLQTRIGHLQEITAVAVSKDPKDPLIVSGSEDGTVRVWDRKTRHERRILRHPAPVRAVACTPPGAMSNLCLTGASDGKGRIWDLDSPASTPAIELKGAHHGPITCVAFSPDGKTCVTSGEDREIKLWDSATGELRYRFPDGHRAAVTSVQFTPLSQLVSAGKDNTLRVWALGQQGARQEAMFDHRSGQVPSLGASPDGTKVLFDQERALRLLSLPEGLTEGVLRNYSAAANFSTFAKFSPDGRLILTAGASQGHVQLWQAPSETTRAREVRQFVPEDRAAATCAAFSPDGSFIVTGSHSREVLIWRTPTREETEKVYTATVTLVDPIVEANAHQVVIWAEMPNPDGLLRPGTSATLVINPVQK